MGKTLQLFINIWTWADKALKVSSLSMEGHLKLSLLPFKEIPNQRLKEVRSKISILLETTGGILFSLEGFQKMLFTI